MLHTLPIVNEDEPFLYRLFVETRADEVRHWGWKKAEQQAFLQMQWKAQQMSYGARYPEAEHRIIIDDSHHIGRIITSQTEHYITLVDLSLLPEHRNRGTGTKLLQILQNEASVLCKTIRLSVMKTNPARRLYERLGFTFYGDSELYDFMEWNPNSLTR